MPNFSGKWTLTEQAQGAAAGAWTGLTIAELYAWGTGGSGQLATNSQQNVSSPVQVSSVNWSELAAGANSSHAISPSGNLYGWGYNGNGELATGTTVNFSSPVQIGALTNWSQLSAGRNHTGAIKTDGTLWMWGQGTDGRLGDGTTISRSSPVQIGALTTWYKIIAGYRHTLAIKTDGTLWAWGRNTNGELGDGTTTQRNSPVQVGALTTWAQASTRGRTSNAVKTDGTIWFWGDGLYGQSGLNISTNVARSSPVQIGALTNWQQSGVGNYHCNAIKTDGTLWGWGYNGTGQIGDGTQLPFPNGRSSPVQVGSLTDWLELFGGNANSAATKTDGTLWMWGASGNGSLGQNDTISQSSPVQIGTSTNWTEFDLGDNFALGKTTQST